MKTLDNKQQSALQKAVEQRFGKAADVPKGFTESVMRQVMAESAPVSRKRSLRLLPWLSAAAAVFIIIMLAVNNQQPKEKTIISQKKAPITKTLITKSDYPKEQESKSDLTINEKRSVANKSQKSTINSQQSTVNSQQSIVNIEVLDDNLHYASIEKEDTVPYQAPSRMMEFIVKMADYNGVKGERLDCAKEKTDTTVVCMAYVFKDTEQLKLFNCLLQAACWYDDKTPGYLLNYSRQQFFFHLKDMRLGRKYLWIAERIGSRILLYCTESPLDVEVPSECFREYRDKITNTSINPKPKEI